DPQIGPDGALWFGDWANPLIGHMQYSQRDPNRDHVHGRIYRLVYKDKPLLKPVTQFGKTVPELLKQLSEYEWRTRARARNEIHSHTATEVLPLVKEWVSKLDKTSKDYDRLCCEALWIQQSFHAVDVDLVKQVMGCKTSDAKAAATRIVADERDYLPSAFDLLKAGSLNESGRTRTEALRGLSYFATTESASAVLESLRKNPPDYFTQYTGEAALGANLNGWRTGYLKGELAKDDPAGKKLLDNVISIDKKGAQVVPYLQILLGKDSSALEQRNKAMQALADMKGGDPENGKQVFRRGCLACHKVFNEGQDFGPDMMKVGMRLTKYKLVESIIDPNADVDKKYLSTLISTSSGKIVTGLLVSENKDEVVIFDGKVKRVIKVADIEERKTLKQSSMPEGLAGTISPAEFLDVIAFLSTLK
ncbi:MAG: heme-binding protein, partial [Planctomycetota bacterium]